MVISVTVTVNLNHTDDGFTSNYGEATEKVENALNARCQLTCLETKETVPNNTSAKMK